MRVRINHPTDRPNFSVVTVNQLCLWFSYETCIAFNAGEGTVARENDWGPTTGKHLNAIGTSNRVPGDVFERMLEEALNA